MGAAENAETVSRGYAAFATGDMATLHDLFAEDAVWHVPGHNSLSGAKEGRDAILAFFGELFTRSGGTAKADLQHVIGGDDHTIGLHTNRGDRNGKVLDLDAVLVFTLNGDGQVTNVQEFHEDTAASDDFWA